MNCEQARRGHTEKVLLCISLMWFSDMLLFVGLMAVAISTVRIPINPNTRARLLENRRQANKNHLGLPRWISGYSSERDGRQMCVSAVCKLS